MMDCLNQQIVSQAMRTGKQGVGGYDLREKLGSGSYGVIYKAIERSSGEVWVLKQISLARLSEKARKSAINEATIMGKLSHPFIVHYRNSFIENNYLNIIMEYCRNGDLAQYLKMQNKKPLPEQKIWKFFLQICLGLQHIHNNRILHRDIKTLNIFLSQDEEVKIGDLGVAKMLSSNDFAMTMVGTPFYLSPELCEEKPYNEKSDIWALGCLLYELCTYRHPFEAQNQGALILKIIRGKYGPIPEGYSQELKDLVANCLQRDYKRRPNTTSLLQQSTQKFMQQLGIDQRLQQHKEQRLAQKQKEQQKNEKKKEDKPQKPVKTTIEPTATPVSKTPGLSSQRPPPQPPSSVKNVPLPAARPTPNPPPLPARKALDSGPPVLVPPTSIHHQKESKNEFMANLEKILDNHDEGEVKSQQKIAKESKQSRPVIKQGPSYADKYSKEAKKEEKIQRLAAKVDDIKKDRPIQSAKRPTHQPIIERKGQTPAVSSRKALDSNPAVGRHELVKEALVPTPPKLPSQEPIKVKQEKPPVQPRVYEQQKRPQKSQGIIKSGGFASNIQVSSKQKPASNSHQKINNNKQKVVLPPRRPSVPNAQKVDDEPKQLFGPTSPVPPHKSQRVIKNPVSVTDSKKFIKKEEANRVSRVRAGARNQMARNAKNASRYNEISKEEQELVANLPNNPNNRGLSSSSSDQEASRPSKIESGRITNNGKFQLKDINHELVVQKYEDIMNSLNDTHEESSSLQPQPPNEPQRGTEPTFKQKCMDSLSSKSYDEEKEQREVDRVLESSAVKEEYVQQELQMVRNSSGQSDELIEQALDEQPPLQQSKVSSQDNNEQKESEWSFEGEPELPHLQQREEPYFQQNDPYLVEVQEEQETTENKITYLQAKLQQNMKREDEINKLMQIKMEECRTFMPNPNSLNKILTFFRQKLNMDSDYSDSDERQIQVFLKQQGLTDHRKFQNIYKIMHFEMELDNTRTIIQRICKKLSDLEQGQA